MPTAATQTSKEFEFYLKTDLSEYKGEYIAIVDDQVAAHGKELKQVWGEAKQRFPDRLPTIAKVPTDEVLILYYHG